MRITNPCRRAYCSKSSGHYYETKGHAINEFDNVLQDYGLCLDRNDTFDFIGDDGRKLVNVTNENGNVVGAALFTWYRMPSGRYEFVSYLA